MDKKLNVKLLDFPGTIYMVCTQKHNIYTRKANFVKKVVMKRLNVDILKPGMLQYTFIMLKSH